MTSWYETSPDHKMWSKTQGYGGARAERVKRFRDFVLVLDMKIQAGGRPTPEEYVQLSILASKMYSPGDYCAFPREVAAALEVSMGLEGITVSTG